VVVDVLKRLLFKDMIVGTDMNQGDYAIRNAPKEWSTFPASLGTAD
jgi:hypothetical protein